MNTTFLKRLSVSIILLLMISMIRAEVVLDGTLGTAGALPGPDYLIGADLGKQYGGNLFHSFQNFNLQNLESATFSGPVNINSIISRVTGGNPSYIDGLIRSTIPDADMYFLNSSGVMFGPNASLDVQGSFHVSTADYLRFVDGIHFDANNTANSLLTVAPPEAFGFLNNEPAPISIQGSLIEVLEGKILSIIGGDIKIQNGYLTVPNGQINLVSTASHGEIPVVPNKISNNNFERFGSVKIVDIPVTVNNYQRRKANVDVSGAGGGNIYIQGGQIIMDNGYMFADSLGSGNGRGITIHATDLVLANRSRITADNFNQASDEYGSGNAGDIDVIADHITLTEGSQIAANTNTSGKAGNINLFSRKSIEISGYLFVGPDRFNFLKSGIYSNTRGIGDGGEVRIKTPSLIISNNGSIRTDTINIGHAGNIAIQVDTLRLNSGANIDSGSGQQTSVETGDGGKIMVEASKAIFISGHGIGGERSGLYSNAFGTGKGGAINILSPTLILQNNGFIQAGSLGEGNAGNISINVDELNLHNAEITTQSSESAGGNIYLQIYNSLYLSDSIITAESLSDSLQDTGGNITISNPAIFTLNNSRLITRGYLGDGGNININTNNFIVSSNSMIDVSSKFGVNGQRWIPEPTVLGIENFTELPIEFMADIARELSFNRCTLSTGELVISFIITARDIPKTSPYDLQTHSILLNPLAPNAYDLNSTSGDSDERD